ncbi:MAG: hypothetical protein ACK47B_03300 [Armatimonadota bacterium]
MKLIPTWVHGIMDYSMAVLFFALPFLFHWGGRATVILTLLAIGTVVYSLLTRYELGAIKMLPMRAHLGLDFLAGVVLVVLALFLTPEPAGVRLALGVIGLIEIGAALLTEPESSVERRPDTGPRARGT